MSTLDVTILYIRRRDEAVQIVGGASIVFAPDFGDPGALFIKEKQCGSNVGVRSEQVLLAFVCGMNGCRDADRPLATRHCVGPVGLARFRIETEQFVRCVDHQHPPMGLINHNGRDITGIVVDGPPAFLAGTLIESGDAAIPQRGISI